MFENASALAQNLLDNFAPFAVFLATFSFMFAALGRSKIFHFERIPRLVLSSVLSLYSAHLVQANAWNNIITIASTAAASGIIGILVYHMMLHRGKTRQESLEEVEDENR